VRASCARVLENGVPVGTAFFIAPDMLLTCAHVVRSRNEGERISLQWSGGLFEGTLTCKRPANPGDGPPWPFPDVAVIELDEPLNVAPLRLSSRRVQTDDRLEGFGFPQRGNPGGESVLPDCGGLSYVSQAGQEYQIRLIHDTIRPGISGAPIALRDSAEIVGMITDTLDPTTERGGHATPTEFLLRECQELQRINVEPPQEASNASERWVGRELTLAEAAPSPRLGLQEFVEPSSILVEHIQLLIQNSRTLRRRARPRDANAIALRAASDPAFDTLLDVDRASVLREIGITYFELGNADLAEQYALQAGRLDPNSPRQVMLIAELRAVRDGYEAALSELPERAVPEIELFRAAYLVQLLRYDEAVQLIESLPEADQSNPRTRRLLILAFAGKRDRARMIAEADAAWPHVADDAQVAFTVGYAYLLQTLALPHWPPRPWSWPQPIPTDASLTVDIKRERLRRAQEIFNRLLRQSEMDVEQVAVLDAWHFVALALDVEREAEAIAEANRLLNLSPGNYRVIPWIWSLSLNIDVSEAMRQIRDRKDAQVASPEEVVLLVVEALDNGDSVNARLILQETEVLFDAAGARTMWHFLMLRVSIAEGLPDTALRHLSFLDGDQRDIAEMLLIESQRGDEAASINGLMVRYETDRDPLVLLLAAELAHRISDWRFLADHGDELFAEFRTLTTARYSIYGTYNLGRLDETIDRISRFAEVFPELPEDLMRVRARALERVGDPNALIAYQQLMERFPNAENLRGFAHYAASIGNYAQLELIAQRLLTVDGDQETDLVVAQLIRAESRDLSIALWRRSLREGAPPDNLILPAFTLAIELGIGDETGPLQEPMRRLGIAGEHGIRLVEQSDVVDLVRRSREQTENALQQYRSGSIAVHALTAVTNATLLATHVLLPRANAVTPADEGWHPVYVRHGARDLAFELPLDRGLYLDATSLLVAADIGALTDLRAVWDRLYVSANLLNLLGFYRDRLEPGQPQRLAALRRILELVDDNSLTVTDESLLELPAIAVVEWGPSIVNEQQLTPRRLVDAMLQERVITTAQHADAVRALGNIQDIAGGNLRPGEAIGLTFNTVETLQEGGVLEPLIRTRSVIVEQKYLEVVKRELKKADEDHLAAEWTASLIEELRLGREGGNIRVVASSAGPLEVNDSPEMRQLAQIFATMPEPMIVVVDDRFINAFSTTEYGDPMVSLFDLLTALHREHRITDERYFELLHKLRLRGAFFIPICESELTAYVLASFGPEGFVPTPELRTLERYVAFALLDREGFNGPGGQGTPAGRYQAAFVSQSGAALRGTLRALFAEQPAFADAVASWLREHFAVDGLPGYGMDAFGASRPQVAVDTAGANFLGDLFSAEWGE
jgi:tetratricopeptide (TPR) repeat protein